MLAASQPLALCNYHKNLDRHVTGDCQYTDQAHADFLFIFYHFIVIFIRNRLSFYKKLCQTDNTIHYNISKI